MPTIAQLMIKGSVWTVKQDFDVMLPDQGPRIPKSSMRIATGALITILGKKEMGVGITGNTIWNLPVSIPESAVTQYPMPPQNPYPGKKYTTTPIVKDGKVFALVPVKSLEGFVEQVGEAKEQHFYVLRDRATGLFYRTTTYPMDKQNPFEMEKTLTKAKHHPDLGKVKITILNFTGYYAGLPLQPNEPEWRAYDHDPEYKYPFLDTFEAVKIEKFSKKEVEVIDLNEWYAGMVERRKTLVV